MSIPTSIKIKLVQQISQLSMCMQSLTKAIEEGFDCIQARYD